MPRCWTAPARSSPRRGRGWDGAPTGGAPARRGGSGASGRTPVVRRPRGAARDGGDASGDTDGPRIVVAGASLADRDEALAELVRQLALAGSAALLLASALAYALAASALRPVEAMRAEADGISAAEPGRRLPVPSSDDEVARLAATLNAMLERLEVALARERRFVADASHELRTPLAVLKTEVELALRHPRSRAELEAALRRAVRHTDELAGLAEDLLVLARSDEGALPLRRAPRRGRRAAQRVADRFAGEAAAQDKLDRRRGDGQRDSRRRRRPTGTGARQSRRQRLALRRRGPCLSADPGTAVSSCTSPTPVPASPSRFCSRPSSALRGPMTPAREAAPAWASPSRTRSRSARWIGPRPEPGRRRSGRLALAPS